MMDPNRYRQIRQIFDEAMALEASERPAFLAGVDPSMRADVERLIAASDRATGVLDHAAASSAVTFDPRPWNGRRLGPYEILREIGEGGMGVVYVARRADGAFEKQVAIKVVRQSLATPEFLARFQRERQILAKLEHPNIARLLDGGSAPDGLAYLVMEFVKGEPLLAHADSRRLRYEERLRLLRQIAEAVDYAHTQGVVHRDLKPSNIFVSADGQVKLLDFGIASWQEAPVAADVPAAPTIALSPAYASPEQARGERTTKASDIYSFAMVAYELLTGVLPFEPGPAPLEQVLRTIVEAVPKPPSAAVRESQTPGQREIGRLRRTPPSEILRWLERIADKPILAALSKREQDRPQSACALMDALEQGPDPGESLNLWRLVRNELSVHAVAWLSLIVFGYLISAGALILQPAAWIAAGLGVFAYLLHRFGWLNWLAGNTLWILIAMAAFAGRVPLLATVLLLVGLWGFFYFQRGRLLGERIYVNASPSATWLVSISGILAILQVVVVLMDFDEPMRWSVPFGFVSPLGFGCAVIPVEIREGGVVVQGRVVRWDEIESYRWLGRQGLAFRLRESGLLMMGSEVRGVVPFEDVHRVQPELSKWLRELPSSEFSLAVRHISDYD